MSGNLPDHFASSTENIDGFTYVFRANPGSASTQTGIVLATLDTGWWRIFPQSNVASSQGLTEPPIENFFIIGWATPPNQVTTERIEYTGGPITFSVALGHDGNATNNITYNLRVTQFVVRQTSPTQLETLRTVQTVRSANAIATASYPITSMSFPLTSLAGLVFPAGSFLAYDVLVNVVVGPTSASNTQIKIRTGNIIGSVRHQGGSFRQVADRAQTEVVARPVDAASRVTSVSRSRSVSVPQVGDSARRQVDYRRFSDELVATPADVASRLLTRSRESLDEVGQVVDAASRQVAYVRRSTDSVDPVVDTAQRSVAASRIASAAVATPVDVASRSLTFGRNARESLQPGDDPLIDPTRSISGVVRNQDGSPYLGGAVVVLYRSDTNFPVANTISSTQDGSYSFPRNSFDPYQYYVAAFARELDPDPIQSVTERSIVPS